MAIQNGINEGHAPCRTTLFGDCNQFSVPKEVSAELALDRADVMLEIAVAASREAAEVSGFTGQLNSLAYTLQSVHALVQHAKSELHFGEVEE